ncbi:MAG: LytR/AlgR family response regulator transcription factor [Candidatus Coproplasma sp.]
MYHIAIVEDDENDRALICSFLARYGKENGQTFKISEFANAVIFLTNYNPVYDVVFIDIQMPHMNGMDAAAKLRGLDESVPLVFITNMSNYAVKGYSVNAVDFVVKPVSYYNFSAMLGKVLRIADTRSDELILKTADGVKRIFVREVAYVEVIDHKVIFHTDKEDFEIWGTLKAQEEKLLSCGFARCNNYCLINLKYVDDISGNNLTVKGTEIGFSRSKKKEFMKSLVEYYGKNV